MTVEYKLQQQILLVTYKTGKAYKKELCWRWLIIDGQNTNWHNASGRAFVNTH